MRQQEIGRLADIVPWLDFVAPGIVLNTNGSIQATMHLVGPDLRAQPPHIKAAMMRQVNNALRQLPVGSGLHSETQHKYGVKPKRPSQWGHVIGQLVDDEDCASLERNPVLESEHYVTLSYRPPSATQTWAGAWWEGKRATLRQPAWKRHLASFKATYDHLVRLLRGIMVDVQPLDDESTWNFLDFSLNMRPRHLGLPDDTHYMAYQLDDEDDWEPGNLLIRGGRYVRTLTVTGFPRMSVALMLSRLNDLDIEYRWVLRWIPLETLEADEELAKAQAAHAFHKRSMLIQGLDRLFGPSEGHDDPVAMESSDEVAEARVDLRVGNQVLGSLTITVTVWDEKASVADDKIMSVRALLTSMGFAAEIETTNVLSAYLGSLAGVTDWNPRKPKLESINVSQLMQVDGVWSGFPWNEHWKCPPLYIARTSKSHAYRVVPHASENAAAHLMGFGSTGSGKSAFLARLRVACQGVPDMRDYGFDFKASSKTTTRCLNGTFTDVGKDRIQFQPFRRIHERDQLDWAQGWVEAWLEDLHQEITPYTSRFIRGSLERLAQVEPNARTIRGLRTVMADHTLSESQSLHKSDETERSKIRHMQVAVRAALEEFEGGILDGCAEFGLDRVHTFELETLFQNMRRARPVMRVIRHLIDDQFDGRPMFLWADELQAFLDDHESAEGLKYWLQRVRDKNGMLACFIHEPGTILDHPLGRIFANNCPNKVFFPNLEALSDRNLELYQMFDLTERHVHQLANHSPRSGYLWKSEGGTRFVEYRFEPFTLAICGRSGKRWHQEVDRIYAEVGPVYFPVEWAKAQGFPEQADVIRQWVEERYAMAAD